MEAKIQIKGMVCDRCISAVNRAFLTTGYDITGIALGEVSVRATLSQSDYKKVDAVLKTLGFNLLENKQAKLVERIKEIVGKVYDGNFDFPYTFRLSALLKEQLLRDYDTISSAFTAAEGITLERYVINYRLDKAKEFLVYTDSTLSDIAFRLGFNSAAHLSKQFKDITGLTAGHYKSINRMKDELETIA